MKNFKHSKSTHGLASAVAAFCALVVLAITIIVVISINTMTVNTSIQSCKSPELTHPTTCPTTSSVPDTSKLTESTKPKTEPVVEEATAENDNYSKDTDLLARVIYLESGDCSEYCQWLVGSTAMNLAEERGGLEAVAYDYNTFNVAYEIDSCTPSDFSYSVAERVLSGDRDYIVKAFRDDYYHNWATPYENVDNMYFSTY